MISTDKYIWKVVEGDETNDNLAVGWYFQDETEQLVGPYFSRQEAIDALCNYAKSL